MPLPKPPSWRVASPRERSQLYPTDCPRTCWPSADRWVNRSDRISRKAGHASTRGRVAVFRHRKGVRWSDGHPTTADDVMLFDENARASDRPTPPPDFLTGGQPIQLTRVDEYTIRFELLKPMGRLLNALGGADHAGPAALRRSSDLYDHCRWPGNPPQVHKRRDRPVWPGCGI